MKARADIAPAIPLGTVIAERSFTLQDSEGKKRQITVRLGCPVATASDGSLRRSGLPPGDFRCPFQIIGLDRDEKIDAPFGEDPFVALQYAINFAGDRLDAGVERLKLRNLYRGGHGPSIPDSWIWRYDRATRP
jgi:hypothetical protein